MPYNFQFTFLGCQHNYLARVTRVSDNGVPQEASITETYGLPATFAAKMDDREHRKRFLYNIHGHDFLSYNGQWQGKGSADDVGHVETAYIPISESSLLQSLCLENEEKKFLGPNMITTFGPKPGSIFVDAYSLKRYEWENLPNDMPRAINKIYSTRGYARGIIWDVAMNSIGGWVILMDKGKSFTFGGRLPFHLSRILQNAQQHKQNMPKLDISIYRIYLNHQHPEEYVLIFGDGQCFVNLHSEFRKPIERLLMLWGKDSHKKFDVKFTSSSNISQYTQKLLNASYYSHRGLFFLSRLDERMALLYLREASHQDSSNLHIRENYCLTIFAMRLKRPRDHLLEDMIRHHRPSRGPTRRPPLIRPDDYDENSFFRDEYLWMLEEPEFNTINTQRRLDEIQRPYLDERYGLGPAVALNEWSYDMAVKKDEKYHELGGGEKVEEVESSPVYEVEGHVVMGDRTDTRYSELSSSTDETDCFNFKEAVPARKVIVLDEPVWEKPKSRNPFARLSWRR